MERQESHRGRSEIIWGCMFCGKSEELIRRVKRANIAIESQKNQKIIDPNIPTEEIVMVFKPSLDDRRGENTVNSHDGRAIDAQNIKNPKDILNTITTNTAVVAIDEAQFFEKEEMIQVVHELVSKRNIRVIVAGLALDFRGEQWGAITNLIPRADESKQLHAICVKCNDQATRTQRLVNGYPANYDDPVVLIGAEESYEARCRPCHEVPNN